MLPNEYVNFTADAIHMDKGTFAGACATLLCTLLASLATKLPMDFERKN
jgi:hypothetical protein